MKSKLGISIFLLVACLGPSVAGAQLALEIALPGLAFTRPVDLQHAPDGTDRLFVVEQAGRIFVMDRSGPEPVAEVFLDIRDRVNDRGNEEGLLGLACHPDFGSSGAFYVNYTASGPARTVIARYSVKPDDPDAADRDSEVILLEFAQPFSNHNGGQLSFGPDGYLYIATGDGGSAGDPEGSGQNRDTLLGKILRIDVDHPDEGRNYGIPPDNPFIGLDDAQEEIYAYGLRNPWRFSFDPATGLLWAADVGQNDREEIDIIHKGGNYGWNIMEGNACYSPPSGCDARGLEEPVWDYTHSLGQSVTGGFVYRGRRVPELTGAYIYADFVSGSIWALHYDGRNAPINTEILDTALNIASFGVDADNELYLCAFDGKIYWFKAAVVTGAAEEGASPPTEYSLGQNAPNPFNPSTTIGFELPRRGLVELGVYDLLGQRVALLANGTLPAGYHERRWGAQGLASGVYLYRLEAEAFVETRKLTLLR